jgi:hypothetical protein
MTLTIVVLPTPVLKEGGQGYLQLILLNITPATTVSGTRALLVCRSSSGSQTVDLGELCEGENRKQLLLPEAPAAEETSFTVTYGPAVASRTISRVPVRRWTVFLALHSHTDLGFTAPLSDVVEIHNRNTDLAVQHCRDTGDLPLGNQFKWTCEVSWQVKNYIRDRSSADVALLMEQVRTGRIEIGGLYAGENTDVLGHEEAVRSLYYGGELRRQYGVPVDTVLLSDVPGCTSGFVQVMAKAGIRNFLLADNNFIAPFLERSNLPRPFLWKGVDETSVLCWFTDHPYYAYVEGELYGFNANADVLLERLPLKLLELEKSGYELSSFQIQYAFDNAELNTRPAEIVRDWNRSWAWPKIRLATPREFFGALRREARELFQVRSGDWTSWWASIATGFPTEASLTRDLHDRLPLVETILAFADLHGTKTTYPSNMITSCYDRLLAFDEHSGGGGIWKPKSREQQLQALREGYGLLYSAARDTASLEVSAAQSLAGMMSEDKEEHCVALLNMLGWKRRFCVKDQGKPPRLTAAEVPPYGYRVLSNKGSGEIKLPFPEQYSGSGVAGVLENERFRIAVDHRTGQITSLFSKEMTRELLKRSGDEWGTPLLFRVRPVKEIEMGVYIPELYSGIPAPGERIDVRQRAVIDTGVELDDVCGHVFISRYSTEGVLWCTRRVGLDLLNGAVFLENTVHRSLADHQLLKRAFVDLCTPNTLLYFQFPFGLDEPKLAYESPNGIQYPPGSQFAGGCQDFYAVQHWLLLSDAHISVAVSSPDAPLMDFASPGLLQYKTSLDGNLANIYVRAVGFGEWGTNRESPFSTGDLRFRFMIDAFRRSRDVVHDTERACRMGWEMLNPIQAIPVSGKRRGELGTFVSVHPTHIHMLTFKKAEVGQGYILRLQEMVGRAADAEVSFSGLRIISAQHAMATEETLGDIAVDQNILRLSFQPHALQTVRLHLESQ